MATGLFTVKMVDFMFCEFHLNNNNKKKLSFQKEINLLRDTLKKDMKSATAQGARRRGKNREGGVQHPRPQLVRRERASPKGPVWQPARLARLCALPPAASAVLEKDLLRSAQPSSVN